VHGLDIGGGDDVDLHGWTGRAADLAVVVMRRSRVNAAARLNPVSADNEHPALRLAGCLLFVGVNPNGRISIAVDGPEHPDESLPLQDGLPSVRLEINERMACANDGTEID
jgi:hypothetical protein